MEIEIILEKLADKVGKRKTDLKKTYNSIIKKKREEGLDEELLGEDGFQHLGLLGTCKRYDIDPDILDTILLGDDKEIEKIEEKIEKEEEEIKMSDDWKEIFSDVKDPTVYSGEGEESDFEKLPSFKPMINVKYHLMLRNPTKAPNKVERDGIHGFYRTYPTEVVLMDVLSDLDAIHDKGSAYTFWMGAALDGDRAKEFDHFAKFWKDLGSAPDDRVFEVLKTQGKSKKGRTFNIWKFAEV